MGNPDRAYLHDGLRRAIEEETSDQCIIAGAEASCECQPRCTRTPALDCPDAGTYLRAASTRHTHRSCSLSQRYYVTSLDRLGLLVAFSRASGRANGP